MSVYAYLRVSSSEQDVAQQKYTILEYCNSAGLRVDEFIEVAISSQKRAQEEGFTELLDRIESGACLVVAELSRLGRSLGQIVRTVDSMIKRNIRFISVKEKIDLNGEQDLQSTITIAMFGLFAQIEQNLISTRTKQALSTARDQGKTLGRPPGTGKSKLDQHESQIRFFLKKGVSMRAISQIMEIPYTTLCSFVKRKGLKKKEKE